MLAIIGGSGIYEPVWLADVQRKAIETPYGPVLVTEGIIAESGRKSLFINRHGDGHQIPPHQVNYRANVWALRDQGATQIIATAAVGSMNPAMPPGALVLPDQFLDFTKNRIATYFEGGGGLGQGVVHTDVTWPFCETIRDALVAAAEALSLAPPARGGVYVCTEGPRFETPAEIRAYRILGGDLVGMTAVPEVVLARELGLCYQTVALVTNWAAGLTSEALSHEEVLTLMAANTESTSRLLAHVLTLSIKPCAGDQ